MKHEPVLLTQILEFLRPPREDATLVDATVGLGGHAEALLRVHPRIRLVAIDRDPEALERSRERLSPFADRVTFVRGRHESLIEILKQSGITETGGILADLGVSSMQLDDAARGFSFRSEGPLDMRMGPDSTAASEIVNTFDEHELAKIIRDWGEEPMAKRIARAIVQAREESPIETTTQLADIVRRVKKRPKPNDIDPATLTFQALRIAANAELVELEKFIDDAVSVLERHARLAVISFHSLEDRIVKLAFRRLEGECICPPGLPVCACGKKEIVKALTKRPMTASEEELNRNPRSRSAKLRVAEKI